MAKHDQNYYKILLSDLLQLTISSRLEIICSFARPDEARSSLLELITHQYLSITIADFRLCIRKIVAPEAWVI